VTDLLDELFSFPSGRHDDFVDCLAYASLQASERKPRIHAYQGQNDKGDRVGVLG
jgi:phage terminase large subunit-like protein